jgi:hypothetical protein
VIGCGGGASSRAVELQAADIVASKSAKNLIIADDPRSGLPTFAIQSYPKRAQSALRTCDKFSGGEAFTVEPPRFFEVPAERLVRVILCSEPEAMPAGDAWRAAYRIFTAVAHLVSSDFAALENAQADATTSVHISRPSETNSDPTVGISGRAAQQGLRLRG